MPSETSPSKIEQPDSFHDVLVLAFPGVQALDLTGPHEVFATANRVAARMDSPGPRYRLRVLAADPGPITTESGLLLCAEPLPPAEDVTGSGPTTLLIPGGDGARELSTDDPTVGWVATVGQEVDRLASVCTGAFIAAAAGLLEGRQVTTHWARANRLQHDYPTLDVHPDAIFIRDGHVWTSAGVTAGIDLALAMVEADLGTKVAQTVARWLVVFLRRPGGQSQFAPTVWASQSIDGPIRTAQELIAADPARVGNVAELAREVGLSPRHFHPEVQRRDWPDTGPLSRRCSALSCSPTA